MHYTPPGLTCLHTKLTCFCSWLLYVSTASGCASVPDIVGRGGGTAIAFSCRREERREYWSAQPLVPTHLASKGLEFWPSSSHNLFG